MAAASASSAQGYVPQLVPMPSMPPRQLERGMKLYEHKDYSSALLDIAEVLSMPGLDPLQQQRAEFFMAKSYFQLRLYAAALVWLDRIATTPAHKYRDNSLKWLIALLEHAPNAGARAALEAYSESELSGLILLGEAIDGAHYELGYLATINGAPAAKRLLESVAPASKYSSRAHLELARLAFQSNDVNAGLANAGLAASDAWLAREAVREIAVWTHRLGAASQAGDTYRAIAAARSAAAPFATAARSRLEVEAMNAYPGFSNVSVDAFNAVTLASVGHTYRTRLPSLRTDLVEIRQILTATREPLHVAYGATRERALFVPEVACTDALTVAASMDSSPVPIAAKPLRGCGGCGTSNSGNVGAAITVLCAIRRRRRGGVATLEM